MLRHCIFYPILSEGHFSSKTTDSANYRTARRPRRGPLFEPPTAPSPTRGTPCASWQRYLCRRKPETSSEQPRRNRKSLVKDPTQVLGGQSGDKTQTDPISEHCLFLFEPV